MKKYFGIFIILALLAAVLWLKPSSTTKDSAKGTRTEQRQTVPRKVNDAHFKSQEIPDYVISVYHYVKAHGDAPEGFVGGRIFQNRERRLPIYENDHRKIKYQEWDVHPKERGQNRGAERLITGNNQRAYYTADHYQTFQPIEE